MGPRLAASLALVALALPAHAQEDVSTGGRVESDLYQHADHPPTALIDGDVSSHFCQHRLEDSQWRLVLPAPALLTGVSFVQGWSDWDQVTRITLEVADGSTRSLDLAAGTRDVQSFELDFPNPTAFVDFHVDSVEEDGDDSQWGGFAEIGLEGMADASDTEPPAISGVAVEPESDTAALVSWTTDEPATSQVRFSSLGLASLVTAPDLAFVTDHAVRIEADDPLMGWIEIRSTDEAGNRAGAEAGDLNTMDTSYSYGVGGWSFNIDDAWVPAPELLAEDSMEVDVIQQWIGGSGWTDWFSAEDVAAIHEAGYVPEVIHYYFGDPDLDDVIARSDEFLADIQTLADILTESGVGDHVIVTLEPEFNQGRVATWDGWNDLIIQAIDILRPTGCKVGLLAGDWDIDHVLPISMGRAAAYSDFVAFQEMRASTQNDRDQALEVPDRAIRFSRYLRRTFMRPVRLGYLMVSDYNGWTDVQRQVVVDFCERRDELEEAGVVAVAWMSYMDRPGAGGYFAAAEAHKGLKHHDNRPKPAFHIFRECVANGPTWLETGEWPPGGEPLYDSPDGGGCGCEIVR